METDDLFENCLAFVEEQSRGEWGDVLMRADAVKLKAFVLDVLAVRDGWRDMASAPKDGTKIDLLYPGVRGRTINCFWRGTSGFGWVWRTPRWKGPDLLPEDQWETHCYPNMEPMYWMPAPPSPVEACRG